MEFKYKSLPSNFLRTIGWRQTGENNSRPEVGQSYDPEPTALCVKCGERLFEPRSPVEFKVPEQPDRVYFFRAHRECDTEDNRAKAIDIVNQHRIVEALHRNAI